MYGTEWRGCANKSFKGANPVHGSQAQRRYKLYHRAFMDDSLSKP
ncbi:MAG: hypothetical protein BAJALOKI3v1_430030 [Promethearchaeota archaeon]|nr:MAG: hypothetical protein BAJALOKI3v1_430030 [Candidatus Lokiarchaeota archaeon]